jgi:anti-sigma regulatory factor (Ser/Thr protein kinase)
MNVTLPNSAFIGNIESFTKDFDTADDTTLNVFFNEKWISVHPVVLAIVSALALRQRENKKKISVQSVTAKSRPYLQRMRLFDYLGSAQFEVVEHEASGRFIPLAQVKNSTELGNFITEMIPLLHTTPEQADPIKYVMSELLRNVLEHSKYDNGATVCAQYFKKSNRISIGIADCGIGIKDSINYSHDASNDIEAIKLALMPGITGTTKMLGGTEFNAGAGLFFTKSIAKVSRDFFMLYSGNGLYKLLKTPKNSEVVLFADPMQDRNTVKSTMPYFPGTAVGIDISMDINQEFEKLLEMIRKAYFIDVDILKKAKYKKPRFL